MRLSLSFEREQKRLRREVEILKKLPPHGNIVQLVDAFEEGDWFLLVLELMGGGDLFTVLTARRPPKLLERETTFVLRQLADGLAFLHRQGVIHRDLKLENVLVSAARREQQFVLFCIKIADFGLSKIVGSGLSEACSSVGTAPYAAPEVLNSSNVSHDFSSDLWCLGVLLYVLLVGTFPFDGTAPAIQDEVSQMVERRFTGGEAAKSVVCGLLQLEPSQRLSLVAIYSHEWLQNEIEIGRYEQPLEQQPITAQNQAQLILAQGGTCDAITTHKEVLLDSKNVVMEASSPSRLPAVATISKRTAGADDVVEGGATQLEELNGKTSQPCTTDVFGTIDGVGSTSPAGQPQLSEVRHASLQPDVMQVHVTAPAQFGDRVLGDSESSLRELHPGCQIRIISSQPSGEHRIILIGRYVQCMAVQKMIHERVIDASHIEGAQQLDVEEEVLLFIRAEAVGVVTGKMGFMVTQICQQSGAKIQLLHEEVKGQRPCLVTGKLQSVLLAERHIFDLVKAVPVVPPTWYAQTPVEGETGSNSRPPRFISGKGKGNGRNPPTGLLYGSVNHLTGDVVASPLQLYEEGRPIPKGHPDYEEPNKTGKCGEVVKRCDAKGAQGGDNLYVVIQKEQLQMQDEMNTPQLANEQITEEKHKGEHEICCGTSVPENIAHNDVSDPGACIRGAHVDNVKLQPFEREENRGAKRLRIDVGGGRSTCSPKWCGAVGSIALG